MLTDFCLAWEHLCMRTTLDLEDALVREAKKRAAEAGEPFTRLLERALRLYLHDPGPPERAFRLDLLTKRGRLEPGIDWDDRNALVERMEGRA